MTTKSTLWTPTFISLLILGTLTSTSFNIVNPIISKYATGLGATLGIAGVIAGLFSITALVARPFGAVITDRVNKKHVLATAITIMSIAAFGYSISVNIALLILFRVLHGVAFAISGTATTALIASIVPRNRLGEGIGFYGLGYIVAMAIGPNIGIYLQNNFGYKVNFICSCITLLIAAFFVIKIKYSPEVSDRKKSRISFDDLISLKILPLALIGGILSFTSGIVSSFLVQIGDQRGIGNIGLYFTVMAAGTFILRPLTGRLSDRKGLSYILYPAFILVAAESILLAHASVLWVVLLAAVAKAFGMGAAQPAIQADCMKRLDASKSGVAAATYFIGADIGQGIGPMIGGTISETYGYEAMFYSCVGLIFIGLIGYVIYNLREKKRSLSNISEIDRI